MALATQCPHCHTTFRVANDQLKLHAGIVRCGSCQQIFNGIEHLVAPGAAPSHPSAPSVVPAAAPEAAAPAAQQQAPAIAETSSTLHAAPVHATSTETATLEEAKAVPIQEAAQAPAQQAAPFSADMLDFEEELFTEPLPFASGKPASDPVHAVPPEPAIDVADEEDEEEAEHRHRMALLVEAEADWSIADSPVDANKLARDALLATDTKVFLPAADALLADESQQPAAGEGNETEAESETVSHFDSEAEFHPELLSEFEAAYESGFDAAAADDGQAISLAEPEAEPEQAEQAPAAETSHAADADAIAEDAADNAHALEEVAETPEALEAATPHTEATVETVAEIADADEEPLVPETTDTYVGSDAEQALEAASIRAEHIGDNISDVLESDAPDFVVQAERKKARSKTVRIAMMLMSVLLFLALLAQAAYTMRNQLAAWFPQYKPMLADACKPLNCQISLLAQIDMVSIESNELQRLSPDKNVFSLTLLLRNKGSSVQAWPMLELTLDSDKGQPVLRKVFTPAEYLANKSDLVKGFPGTSEQPASLFFELETIKAAGYHVMLFYP
ncbi:DUF3426 domain-containing protein [Undibacterium sp. TJN25]|uniref:DUF3426 domain-containing protein n=1 Tax=Undibacterium sp. TJN25 TaxID=3413056 RepID=UPI003BF2F062